MDRREFLASLGALSAALTMAGASPATAYTMPANKNVKWALSSALWVPLPPGPFTDILSDVMKETGFTASSYWVQKFSRTIRPHRRSTARRIVQAGFSRGYDLLERASISTRPAKGGFGQREAGHNISKPFRRQSSGRFPAKPQLAGRGHACRLQGIMRVL